MRTYPDTGIGVIGMLNEQVLLEYNLYWESDSPRVRGFSSSINLSI
jgi:hypothetical protein